MARQRRPNGALPEPVPDMKLPAFVLLAALAAPVAHSAVLDASPSGFTLENSEVVLVDADRAWEALVGEVDRWWPRDHTWWGSEGTLSIEPKAGGCFCEIDDTGRRQARHLEVLFVDPGRTLRMGGGLGPLQGLGLQGALEFRLAPEASGGTRITLWYRVGGYSPDDLSAFAPVVDRVQGMQLAALAAHLRAGGEG